MPALDKATLRETRQHNERLVLATIYDGAADGSPVSRADVSRLTGLTRTTVSGVVDTLLATRLVEEIGRGPSTGGKAPIHLAVPDRARVLVGVDLGDREFVAAAVDLRGQVLYRAAVPCADADGAEAVELALGVIGQVLEVRGASPDVLGVGIGAPGIVDPTDGTVIQGVKRSWRELPLASIVAGRFGLPAYVANDSQVAALAEHVFHPARSASLVGVKVGQGIGAGIVIDGVLFHGDGFGAGEIGHTTVDPVGETCRCGRRGCLETVASVPALLGRLRSDLGRPIDLEEAVIAFEGSDAVVRAAVADAGRYLGIVVAGLIGSLNIRRIVFTGPMAAFGEPWLAAVRRSAQAGALPALAADTTLELGRVEDIVVLGASAFLMTRELGLSLRPVEPPRRGAASSPTPPTQAPAARARTATAVALSAQRGGGRS